jgi:hypothetical protein
MVSSFKRVRGSIPWYEDSLIFIYKQARKNGLSFKKMHGSIPWFPIFLL